MWPQALPKPRPPVMPWGRILHMHFHIMVAAILFIQVKKKKLLCKSYHIAGNLCEVFSSANCKPMILIIKITKFKSHQYQVRTISPNLMLAKVTHYTVHTLYMYVYQNFILLKVVAAWRTLQEVCPAPGSPCSTGQCLQYKLSRRHFHTHIRIHVYGWSQHALQQLTYLLWVHGYTMYMYIPNMPPCYQ